MGAASDKYMELTMYLAEFWSVGFQTMENLIEEKEWGGAAVKPWPATPRSLHPVLRAPPRYSSEGST